MLFTSPRKYNQPTNLTKPTTKKTTYQNKTHNNNINDRTAPWKCFLWIKCLKFVISDIPVIHFNISFPQRAKKELWQDCWHLVFIISGERRSLWPTKFHIILIILLLNRFYNLCLGSKRTWGHTWTYSRWMMPYFI